jgi:hypothetical protein
MTFSNLHKNGLAGLLVIRSLLIDARDSRRYLRIAAGSQTAEVEGIVKSRIASRSGCLDWTTVVEKSKSETA